MAKHLYLPGILERACLCGVRKPHAGDVHY